MYRYISHGIQGDALKYLVFDRSEQNLYDFDVELHEQGKVVRLLDKENQELGMVHMTTLEQDTSVWIGVHGRLVGSVSLKRRDGKCCITIPGWEIEGEPYEGDFSILKSGTMSVSVTSGEKNGIPYEKLDISDDQDEHLILLLVLAIEEAVIGRQKKIKRDNKEKQ